MNTVLKQQYLAELSETGDVSAQTLWACVASEVGYGDYSTETSLVDKISEVETSIAAKANASHYHTTGDISGLSVVATTGSYSSLSGTPTLAAVATSGSYNDLTDKPATYTHPESHPASMITGLSTVATTGSYNDLSDKPTIPTVPTSLPANGGNADTVDNMHASEFAVANHTHGQYATVTHGHAVSDVTGLTGELDGKADVDHTHNYAASTHSHTLSDVTETSEKKIMTAEERTKLGGIEAGANNYTHPSTHAANMITGLSAVATSGSYDDLSDKPTTMTPAAHTHAQADVTGLATALAGKAATEHTHNQADVSGLSDALASKADAAHTHTGYAESSHTHAQSEITGLETALSGKAGVSHSHAQSDVTGLVDALAAKASATHTHTAAAVGAATADHNHNNEYILKALQIVADDGNIKHDYVNTDDVLAKMADLGCGMHTCYCPVNTPNSPKSTEAWRFLVHKTGASKNYGWVIAFGSRGSVYSNYIDAGSWRGWKTIHDIEPVALWTGEYYMTASQTVTPSKSLSECQNGWVLLWSDYNVGEGSTNADINSTVIPKRNVTGAKWTGQSMICAVATSLPSTGVINFAGKRLYVHDTKLVGHDTNNVAPGNDVVLRAVYEF